MKLIVYFSFHFAFYSLNFYIHFRFRNSIVESELNVDIIPPFRDDIQLSVSEYRSKLYEIMSSNDKLLKKTDRRRYVNVNELLQYLNVTILLVCCCFYCCYTVNNSKYFSENEKEFICVKITTYLLSRKLEKEFYTSLNQVLNFSTQKIK